MFTQFYSWKLYFLPLVIMYLILWENLSWCLVFFLKNLHIFGVSILSNLGQVICVGCSLKVAIFVYHTCQASLVKGIQDYVVLDNQAICEAINLNQIIFLTFNFIEICICNRFLFKALLLF